MSRTRVSQKGAGNSSEAPDALSAVVCESIVAETSGYVTQFPHDSWRVFLSPPPHARKRLIDQKFNSQTSENNLHF
jgi:hypothetical protein